jgi:YHS domain-containing protein
VINGTGQIIDTQGQVGGWPTLNSLPAPTDTDHDGMPDAWETANGLSPTDAADRNYYTFSTDYTNLEVYLNSLVPNGTYDTDVTPPTPNLTTWQNVPAALNETQINMTAATATDPWGVEYYFANLTVPDHNSGWQDSATYTDTGLAEGSTYTYTVKARDKSPNHNETTPSDPCTAMTVVDTTPPEPNQMTFDVAPHALGIDSIAMVATTATDIDGVEYYFANITDPNHDSSWQNNTDYTDTGLTNNTPYSYSVIARDKSSSQNETAWSDEANATTVRYICTDAIVSDLDENCKVDFMDYIRMASYWNEMLPLNNNIAVNGTFDTDIIPGWQIFDLPSAEGTLIVIYDGDNGDPVGSVLMGNEPAITGTSGHYFYQVLPVDAGKQYKLSAEWMGDISSFEAPDPCNHENWAEVLVAFETNADANTWTVWTDPNAVMYRKAFGVVTQNIDSSGTWPWEPITASQTNGPADGVFTANGDYMVVAFSEGSLPRSGLGYFYTDNVKVEGPGCSTIDLNGDCNLDWQDIQKFAQDWLSCNRNPASECMLP